MKTNFRFLIPRGRLFKTVCSYISVMGVRLKEPTRNGFCGSMELPDGTIEFWARKPSMIPHFMEKGQFDAGITGEDMLIESRVRNLRKITTLTFSSQLSKPTRWVLAGIIEDGIYFHCQKQQSIRIGCEWFRLTEKLLQKSNILTNMKIELIQLHGNEESAICDGLCDLIVCPTETGDSLQYNGLNELEELMESYPCILSRQDFNEEKPRILDGIADVIKSADMAAERVMITFDIPMGATEQIKFPDYIISPTKLQLLKKGWEAGEVCIKRADLINVLPKLRKDGARSIVVTDIQGFLD